MSRSYRYRFEKGEDTLFHWADYLVFGIIIGACAIIGLYYAIKDKRRKKTSTAEFLLAGRKMSVPPVALSMLGSFISANTLLGTPAEMYNYNTMYWWTSAAFLIAIVVASQVFLPVFYNLQITSVYQYVEMRFGHVARIISSVLYMIWMITYMAIVLYGPSLALNAVTGLSLWGSIAAVGGVCIFYTGLGGMKAVVWTDTLQVMVMFAGMLALLIEGSIRVGGLDKAWEIADTNQRIKFDDFDPDPTTRHSFWTLTVGGGILWTTIYGINQAQIQRAMAIPTLRKAKMAMLLNVPLLILTLTLVCAVGIVMYAYYSTCDPVTYKLVKKSDQLLPLFTMDLLGDYHGLPGLILSCIFSGSLSTISSGLNALSAVLLEDFVRPYCCPKLSETGATIFSKFAVFLSGGVCLLFAYIVSEAGSILQVSLSLWGIIGGPMLGMFCLGILFPWSNKWGAVGGQIIALGIMAWIGYGAVFNKVSGAQPSPKSTAGCLDFITTTNGTFSDPITTTMASMNMSSTASVYPSIGRTEHFPLYRLSYLWYTGLGTLITVVIGMLVSLITGATDPKSLDPGLICPFLNRFFPAGSGNTARGSYGEKEFPPGKDITTLGMKPFSQEQTTIGDKEKHIS